MKQRMPHRVAYRLDVRKGSIMGNMDVLDCSLTNSSLSRRRWGLGIPFLGLRPHIRHICYLQTWV